MTEKDLANVEKKLKITLPTAYRELMLSRSDELKSAGFDADFSDFFIDPKEIAMVNKLERPKDSGTGYAFPKWWETFFLIGTSATPSSPWPLNPVGEPRWPLNWPGSFSKNKLLTVYQPWRTP